MTRAVEKVGVGVEVTACVGVGVGAVSGEGDLLKDGVGLVEIVGVGADALFMTRPLLQTRRLPDLMQLNCLPEYIFTKPIFWQIDPAFGVLAVVAGRNETARMAVLTNANFLMAMEITPQIYRLKGF